MKKFVSAILILVVIISHAEIKQNLGVDDKINYQSLEKLGPWDDRNYQLTQEDLKYLPKNDQFLSNVPLFFKVEYRQSHPKLGKYYPRSLLQIFQYQYGGLLVDGVWHKEGLGVGYHPTDTYGKTPLKTRKLAANETPLELNVSGNEVSIECNPTNGNNCVAGSNGSGGQRMYYSSDAGVTWTLSQVNESSSCCDPTIDWSIDGSVVYQGDLQFGNGGANVRWSRSLDQGVTWASMQNITNAGNSDKEFIHVDSSPTSPYKDNVYISWHDDNTMQFAKSTDMGLTMSTPHSFTSEPIGIGSDLTTDSAGNIYYFYPSNQGGAGVRMLKSTDGGDTWNSGIQIATLNDVFDFPIPAAETRFAFIYTSVDIDKNNNDLYVTWTDQTDNSTNGGASANHAWINVAKSTDAGATWNLCPHPHAIDDVDTVDRFHPWLKVGENGTVHIGYYDTRHSNNRTGIDFYYAASTNGCSSWETETRMTSQTSDNIANSQEWGDYNGLSVVLDKIAVSFTDNRATSSQSAMIATDTNQFASLSFNLSSVSTNNEIAVCANDSELVTIDVLGQKDYDNPVTFSEKSTPNFITNINFSVNPIDLTTQSTTMLSFDVINTGTTGKHKLSIQAVGDKEAPDTGTITKTLDFNLLYSAGTTLAVNLMSPTNNSINAPVSQIFSWATDANATNYHLMV